ncbi:nuclease-related domain-containing protein [Corynebacterium bovis]|uniref:NERD domain-containing protein n=1 Tax=Corynebacterium bovis TaxID=36808 RepID=A0A3R8QDF8_9CORY|nr:nuclease-related domain-containing protein [Corynebacterium bovis]MDN8579334.1 nuclease-related domain-containing protein [Corynebacterium bovis]RRO85866.1 hypothetical protein CXF48_09200 [Corynebacterium bovis]
MARRSGTRPPGGGAWSLFHELAIPVEIARLNADPNSGVTYRLPEPTAPPTRPRSRYLIMAIGSCLLYWVCSLMAISVDMSGIGNAALVIGAVLVVVLIARRVRHRARCRAAARSPLDDIPTSVFEKFGPTVNEAVRLARQRDRRAFTDRFDYYDTEIVNAAMGAATEEWIGGSLENALPESWDIAHDVLILSEPPATGVSANIDHLLSGPAGLVMVDAKHWIGETVLAEDGRLVRYRGPSRQKSVETCLFEASCLAVPPVEIVIAVDGGTVRDGFIRVPRIDPSLPDIPVAVVEWSLVPAYLETMEPDVPIDLDRLIAASPRVVAG